MCRQGVSCTILAGMLWLWCTCSVLAQQSAPVPEFISPGHGDLYAWGQSAPTIRIEVRAAPSSATVRHYVTANVFAQDGRLIDRVPLYDDGTHNDTVTNDGTFISTYIPSEPGIFRVKARLEQQDTLRRSRSEKWSDTVTFSVEQVPYVQIVSPKPNSSVASHSKLSGMLLVGSEKRTYTPKRDEVRIRCWSEPAASIVVPEKPSSEFSVRIEFPRPGKYQLFVSAQTLRNGRWIESEPYSLTVSVTTASWTWLYISLFLLLIALLVPGKRVPLYRHDLLIIKPNGYEEAEIMPSRLEKVFHRIPGTGIQFLAQPGQRWLHVVGAKGEGIPSTLSKNGVLSLPNGYTVHYTNCEQVGYAEVQRYKLSTTLKRNLVIASIILLIIQVWNYWRFTQLM